MCLHSRVLCVFACFRAFVLCVLACCLLPCLVWLRGCVLDVFTCFACLHVRVLRMFVVLKCFTCSQNWCAFYFYLLYIPMVEFRGFLYQNSHFDRFFIKSCCKYSKVILTFSSFIFTLANYFLLVCLHFVLFINSQFTAFTSFVIDTIKCIDRFVLPIYISQHKVKNIAKLDHYLMLLC